MEDRVVHVSLSEIRNKAWKLCRNFLQGSWASIEAEEMEIQEICGGLCNLMYHCSLPPHVKPRGREPSEVLLRIFGKALQEHDSESAEAYLTGLIIESVIFTLLSERKLGPKLMGVFPGGRLEEYIPAKSMNSSQLRNKKYSDAIARKLAKFHRLSVPINKDAGWLFKTMSKWQSTVSKIDAEEIEDARERVLAKQLLSHDFQAEIEWLRKAVERVNSPLVFCHNDLQGGNILLRDVIDNSISVDDSIVVIDYEFCSYNYRGFDIANHLCEWMFDYNRKNYPFYTCQKDKFPTKERQGLNVGRIKIKGLSETLEMSSRNEMPAISDPLPWPNDVDLPPLSEDDIEPKIEEELSTRIEIDKKMNIEQQSVPLQLKKKMPNTNQDFFDRIEVDETYVHND